MWSLTSQLVMYYDILRKFNGDLCKCGRVVRAPHLKCGGCMLSPSLITQLELCLGTL